MKNIILTIIILTTVNLTVKSQNITDSLGLKQGVWITSWNNGKYFYKTYKNDTLDGLYYRKYKSVLEEKGYYKNGLKDSIWLIFNNEGLLEKKIFYKNGLKEGLSITFRDNSNLLSEQTYRNDTLIKSYSYYSDYSIYSYYSIPDYYAYFQDGSLKLKSILKANFRIDSIYNERGSLIFPKYYKSEIIENDTSIINTSEYNVTKLFCQDDRENPEFKYFPFLFVYGGQYFVKDTVISVLFEEDKNSSDCELIQITPNSIKRTNLYSSDLGDTIQTIKYETLPWEYRMTAESKIIKQKHRIQFGKLSIYQTPGGCDDTGRNPFEILTKKGKIEFKDIDNLIIFEIDLDKDNFNELYVVSYISCMSYMKIYRIDTK